MTANATIDITSLGATNLTENVNKTYSDSSVGFDKVFDSVSKNYYDKKSDSDNKTETKTSSADNKKSKTDTETQKTKSSSDDNKVKEDYSDKKTNETKSDETSKVTDTKENSTEKVKTSSDTQTTAETEVSTTDEDIQDIKQKLISLLESLNTSQNVNVEELSSDLSTINDLMQKLIKKFADNLANVDSKEDATDSSDAQALSQIQGLLAELQQAITNSQNSDELGLEAKNVLAQQVSAISAELNPQTAQETQDGDKSASLIQSANLKIQTQGQVQPKTSSQSDALAQNQAQTQAKAQSDSVADAQNTALQNDLPDEAVVETPVIKVATEVVASDVNATDLSKQNLKDALNKTSLTQEVLDKTDAKVVKVEKTSADSSNSGLLNNQNAQEQAVKLSLQTPEAATVQDASTSQTSFSSVIDKVQTQTLTSREISQTEIMSQVNSKLANFKTDESTKMTIVLRPENLGKINLELVTNKEGFSAQITAENAQVKEILDKNIDGLKESLGNQGVNVNSVTVKVAETQKQDNTFSFDAQTEQDNQQAQENQNAKQGEFTASLDEELETGDEVEAEGTAQILEKSVSINSHLGQVDYKV